MGGFLSHVPLRVLSNAALAVAYCSISIALWSFVRRRPGFAFRGVSALLTGFVFACGATYALDAWAIWDGPSPLNGGLRVLAAALSLAAAVCIVPLLSRASRQPSVADLEETQQRLRDSEERFSQFIENFPGLAYLKEDGRYVIMNHIAIEALHYPPDSYRGRSADELQSPENAARVAARDAEVLRTNRTVSYMDTYEQPDGIHHWFVQRFPVRRDAATPSVGVVAIDVTDRKLAEEALAEARDRALEASRMKSEFVSTVTHELRTPLSAIIGTAELMRMLPGLGEREREYIKTIDASAEALLSLINGILDFSKIEAGALELQESDFDPEALVEATTDVVIEQARSKGIAFHTYVDPLIPGQLRGDPQRLRQILLNLIGNAVKFTDHGSIVVRALPLESTSDHVILRFEVQDTGVGIPPEAIETLFEPFTQADTTIARRFGGTGLGLSITKRLVELMNGTISIVSEPGRGSLFWFTARFKRIATIPVRRSLAGLRALIISQDDIFTQIVTRYAASWNVATWHAKTVEECLTLLNDAAERGHVLQMAIVDDDGRSKDVFEALAASHAELIPLVVGAPGSDLRKPIRPSHLFDRIVALVGMTRDAQTVDDGTSSWSSESTPLLGGILVAEDSEVIRAVITEQLATIGYACTAVRTGGEAVAEVAARPYDLVLMDCQMPETDGFEATRLIRTAERQTGRHVPIVAMTANAFREDRERCLEAGMDDYLPKPVRLAELRAMIDAWLPERRQTS
jgi:PAS domain S-box-containing protein